jgi:DNA-binding NarL/FixJ family response regulator
MIRIIIVSGNDSERYTIQKFLDAQTDISIVGQGRDGYDAFKLVSRLKPNIALLDEMLPVLDGAEITPALKYQSPKTRIIILTSFNENSRVLKAISNGASGYILKNTRWDKFIAGIRIVYDDGCLMSPEIAAKAFRMSSNIKEKTPKDSFFPSSQKASFVLSSRFSRQELQVIHYIAQGLVNKKIGECLSLKEGTVRNYITTILEKTGLKNRTQLALFAYNIGLIKEEPEPYLPGKGVAYSRGKKPVPEPFSKHGW